MADFIKKTAFVFFIILPVYYLSQNIFDYKKKLNFYKDYKKDYQEQLDKNKKLRSDILKNQDPYLVEKNIRQKLNLLKPGETIVILPKTTPTPSPPQKIEKPVYQQWWELFFYAKYTK